MPWGQDLDLMRRYRRTRGRVGSRGERRRRRFWRRDLIALIVFALALLVVGLISSAQGVGQRIHEHIGPAQITLNHTPALAHLVTARSQPRTPGGNHVPDVQ
jgi:hypothetical protein